MKARLLAAALLVGLALAGPAAAAPPAPLLSWRTLDTDWCAVHFHPQAEYEARRVAALCDEAVHVSAALIGGPPLERIQVVVADSEDRANGFTRTVPYNLVVLYTIAPAFDSELSHTEDHLRLLLVHEILHVVHLDTFSGLPEIANSIFGKFWPPNLIQPRWVVEGIAVYLESQATNGGRLKTDRFFAHLRLAALHNDLWSLDDVSNFSRRNPGGNAAYLYGSHFLAWLIAREGPGLIARLAHEYGSHAIPYAVQRSFRVAGDIDLTEAYETWRAEIMEEAWRALRAVKARGGPHRSRRLTRLGGSSSPPVFDDEGTLWFSTSPPNGDTGIYRVRGLPSAPPALEAVLRINAASPVAVLDDERVAFAHREQLRGWLPFYDLFTWQPGEPVLRVTAGRRFRTPIAMPDGERVVAARRDGEVSAVALVEVPSGKERTLVRYADGTQTYTPRPSSDGAFVAYSRLSPGGARNIVEIDVKTGVERLLTAAASDDADPAYTPDGRWVVFASDRSGGIFNVFAVERATGRVVQVTDTLGLASSPVVTPDGRAIVYRDLTLQGDDLFVAALDLPPPELPAEHNDSGDEIDEGDELDRGLPPAPLYTPFARHGGAARLYNPLLTLGPRTWQPLYLPGVGALPVVGVALSGADAVDMIRWSAEAGYDLGVSRPRAAGHVRFLNLLTPVTLSGSLRTVQTVLRVGAEGARPLQETLVQGGVDVSLPFRRWFRAHRFAIGYTRTHYLDEGVGTVGPPDGPAPRYPLPRNIGSVVLSWTYSDTRRDRDDVSSSRGQSFTLRWRASNALTLSELDLYEATFDARVFRAIPGLPQHVLAVYVSGGWATGTRSRRANYRLGGFYERSFLDDVISQRRFGSGYLRGYKNNVDIGDGYALASAEYRFPLLEIERGIESLPLQASRLTAAVFADIGDAFDGFPSASDVKTSVGGELRLRLVLGYYGSFQIRAGYARGLNPGGVHQPYLLMGVPF